MRIKQRKADERLASQWLLHLQYVHRPVENLICLLEEETPIVLCERAKCQRNLFDILVEHDIFVTEKVLCHQSQRLSARKGFDYLAKWVGYNEET